MMSPGTADTESAPVSRRTALKALGAAGAFLGGVRVASGEAQAVIPETPTLYQISLTGHTSHGVQFQRSGVLAVSPPFDTLDASGTGVNVRDIAIRSGYPAAFPEAGALWFATNTALYPAVGIASREFVEDAMIDVAVVNALDRNTLHALVGGDIARAAQLNSFNASSGIAAGVYQIAQAELILQFSEDGTALQGEIGLLGVGYVGPGTPTMYAVISGVALQPQA